MRKIYLDTQREAIQDDLRTFLDGMDDSILDKVCQIVVDHFAILDSQNEKSDGRNEPTLG